MTDYLDKFWSLVQKAEQIQLQSQNLTHDLNMLYQVLNKNPETNKLLTGHTLEQQWNDLMRLAGATSGQPQRPTRQGFYPTVQYVDEIEDRGAAHIETATEVQVQQFQMTGDQGKAWSKLQTWLQGDEPFFSLKGVAGAGKSFLMKKLSDLNHNLFFVAPTNKAASVLSAFLGYNCRTIYSLFGFRMEENEEKMVLSALKELPRLGTRPIIVTDEAGMVSKPLVELMKQLAREKGWRFINVGDPYQLNPVGEKVSAVWKLTKDKPDCRVMMTEVKRFDNQILACSIAIRQAIKDKEFGESPIKDDNSNDEGVFTTSRMKIVKSLKDYDLDFWRTTKIGAWRNKTVNEYNSLVRDALGFGARYEPGELVLAGQPVTVDKAIVAHTDEEFQVEEVTPMTMKFDDIKFKADALVLKDKNFKLMVPRDEDRFQQVLANRAMIAREAGPKTRKAAWAAYWEVRNTFHTVRYGYAKTAHRLQGSTLENIIVDQGDVLANRNDVEAFRALYVLATRPTKKLIAF